MPTPSLMAASTYDVFLSFHRDTRNGFSGNLCNALAHRGIHTFVDNMELPKGPQIIPALLKAIQDSRIAIVVLSHNYASSSYCLDELETILHCLTKGLFVIPVFYKVRPSDVRNQKGSYGKALSKLQKRFKDEEKLQKWKMALCQVANLSGYHFEDGVGYEHKFIERIVEHVYHKITRASFLHVADHPVGLYSQVLEVRKLLGCGSEDGVKMIGIHGMGGIGKSTLARAVYNDLIAENFDGLCFLENVREKANKHGLKHLQSILLSQILGEKDVNLTSKKQGISMIKNRLKRKKVLLILDDVDKPDQLQAVAGGREWFGPGSIIMVTTRDKQLLTTHQVTITYEVKGLNDNDALQLLKWKAFGKSKVDPAYELALNRAQTYASGLPLALEVIGSNLAGKSVNEWESSIKKYGRHPKREILDMLKLSFDALDEEEKNIFLDIVCFFKGCALTEVQDKLHAYYGHSIKHHIGVLVENCLLQVDFDDRLTMHDLIEDMVKMIVRMELQKEQGKNSRLWLPNVAHVSDYNTRTSESKINYHDDFLKSEIKGTVGWDANTFKWTNSCEKFVKKLLFLLRNHNYFPQSWRAFALDNLLKKFENLTVTKFEECKILTQTPDVSDLPHLKELSFKGCENLITVHDSVGFLTKLKILRVVGCSKLNSVPPLNFTSLESLELTNCSILENTDYLDLCCEENLKLPNIPKINMDYFRFL